MSGIAKWIKRNEPVLNRIYGSLDNMIVTDNLAELNRQLRKNWAARQQAVYDLNNRANIVDEISYGLNTGAQPGLRMGEVRPARQNPSADINTVISKSVNKYEKNLENINKYNKELNSFINENIPNLVSTGSLSGDLAKVFAGQGYNYMLDTPVKPQFNQYISGDTRYLTDEYGRELGRQIIPNKNVEEFPAITYSVPSPEQNINSGQKELLDQDSFIKQQVDEIKSALREAKSQEELQNIFNQVNLFTAALQNSGISPEILDYAYKTINNLKGVYGF